MKIRPALIGLVIVAMTLAARASDYVVVASAATHADAKWAPVIDTLIKKHHAELVLYDHDVAEVRPALADRMPRYTCFVARPEEAGRLFVVTINRITRDLDADPYSDTVWGIITGRTADDAMRIAQREKPLLIRSALAGTGIDLSIFDSGKWFSETAAGEYHVKTPGKTTEKMKGPTDSTAELVKALNAEPDLFLTSGHGSERDWQIGYTYRNGFFRCFDGKLFGLDTKGDRLPIHSPNAKVYMPVGNCLIGHVDGPNALALAYMSNSLGVDQMIGYTVVTWFGRGGWGTRDYFFDLPSRYDLAEAFFFNNQTMTRELLDRYPKTVNFRVEHWDAEREPQAIGMALSRLGYHAFDNDAKENLGLLWDRDAVAFYGDPEWVARLAPRDLPITTKLTRDGRTYHFTITAHADAQPARPLAMLLPHRLTNINVTEGSDLDPLITDNFIMVLKHPKMSANQIVTISFTADEIAPKASAAVPPDQVDDVLKLVPDSMRDRVRQQLKAAENNAGQLAAAIRNAPDADQRGSVIYLVANMPRRDLLTLDSSYLLSNVADAWAARRASTWAKAVPLELFEQDVLPVGNFNEIRDGWRAKFYSKYIDAASKMDAPQQVVAYLNKQVFADEDVHYHATKRPKPDQCPSESAAAGYASCSGLSIMLVDACRAVGLPARTVGTPLWADQSGNHTWTEVWDGREWRYIGSAEPNQLDHAWFTDKAAKLNPSGPNPMQRIYAAAFATGKTPFPLVWDPAIGYVAATDVTPFYTARGEVIFNTHTPGPADLTVRYHGQIVAHDTVHGAASTKFILARGVSYQVTLHEGGKTIEHDVTAPADGSAIVVE